MLELYETIERNEHQYLRTLLNLEGEEKSLPQKRKNILLLLSSELGHPECCQILLKLCACVDSINDYNETPLHLSSWYDHYECCKILLEHRASPNGKNSNGWTPLQTAFWKGNEDCITVLLDNDLTNYKCLVDFGDIVKLSDA